MLFLTDKDMLSHETKKRLSDIEECTFLHFGQTELDRKIHNVIVCDISIERSAVSETKSFIEKYRYCKSIPLLYLSHESNFVSFDLAKEINATVVMQNHTSIEQILFFVRRLIENRKTALFSPVPPARSAISINVGYAAAIYKQILDSVRYGKPINPLTLERGSDAIIAAVGGQRMSVWLDVVRAYDDATYQHCLLVAGFAVLFSQMLGISINNQRLISKSALIHDIGKLNIPLEILNKPGKLTTAEMEIIKTHPSVGHELLLRQGGFDGNTLDMVRHHHEYLDGSGYPDGIYGDSISSFVRIITICDIYSALIERRYYKEPLSSNKAIQILKKMEQKIDQNLVDKFEIMLNQSYQ